MWFRLRNTASRGRSGVPARRSRMRAWRLVRAAVRLASLVMLLLPADLACLAGLAAYLLARVADALALVGLRLPRRADLGGDLPDELLVDPDHRDAGRVLELERDARGRVDLHRV